MSETNSQSIRSDRISESTIARIAGNLLSGHMKVWGVQHDGEDEISAEARRRAAVEAAVDTARLIAEVVRETAPETELVKPTKRAVEDRSVWKITGAMDMASGHARREWMITLDDSLGDVAAISAMPQEVQDAIRQDMVAFERTIRVRMNAWVLKGDKGGYLSED